MKLLKTKKLKSLSMSIILLSCFSYAYGNESVSKSVCSVEKLEELGKPAIDLLGSAVGYFNCETPIGATEPKSRVIAYVSEHDYANISKIFKTKAHVDFGFKGTYAGVLFSYDGKMANNEAFKPVRTGIETHGQYTTLTFVDVNQSTSKNINEEYLEAGELKVERENISLELTSKEGIGQLKLTVLTKDIAHSMIAVSNGIKLPNGQAMASDQFELSNKSAFIIANLLKDAGMFVNKGSTPARPGHHGSFWDYIYLDKDGQNPLFHCANMHSGEKFTSCYLSQMRLK